MIYAQRRQRYSPRAGGKNADPRHRYTIVNTSSTTIPIMIPNNPGGRLPKPSTKPINTAMMKAANPTTAGSSQHHDSKVIAFEPLRGSAGARNIWLAWHLGQRFWLRSIAAPQ